MITRDNLQEVIQSLSSKDKKRILNNYSKEFIVLEAHCFNVGAYVTVKLTNNYNRYKNVSDNGNCILFVQDVTDMLKNKEYYG